MNYCGRLEGLQQRMEEKRIHAVIYGSCQNFQYLTGLPIEWRNCVDLNYPEDNVFVPREGEPKLTLSSNSSRHADATWIKDVLVRERDVNYRKMIESISSDIGWEGGCIGIGEHLWGSTILNVASVFKGASFVKAEALMDDLRMIKDVGEIKALKQVAQLTDDTMKKVIEEINKGTSMRELKLEIEMTGRRHGASNVSFPSNTGFMRSGSQPNGKVYNYEDDEGLTPGSAIWFDVGFIKGGYCSDWGRSLYLGDAPDEIINAYVALQRAVVETVEMMGKEIVKVNEVFPKIEEILDKEGFGDFLRARLPDGKVGHQIGVEVHEEPWLKPENDHELQEGMVMCLEPKLWHDGEYYLRVEDMILINKHGAEFLTKYDREHFLL